MLKCRNVEWIDLLHLKIFLDQKFSITDTLVCHESICNVLCKHGVSRKIGVSRILTTYVTLTQLH